MSREIIKRTEQFVKDYLLGAESGHNWWHIYRVRNIALHISAVEKSGDPFIIEMSSLLHETGDYKIEKESDTVSLLKILDGLKLKTEQRDKITYIIDNISFRNIFDPECKHLTELDIVQDSDRLDAMGAIGIARAFNYGGSRGFDIYNPDKAPKHYKTREEYTGSDSSTINHFYEKLLKLKDLMNTETGKKLAEARHIYMQEFLEQFFSEWNMVIKDKR